MRTSLVILLVLFVQRINSQNVKHSFHLGFGLKRVSFISTVKHSRVYWPTSTVLFTKSKTGRSFDNFPSLEVYYQARFKKLSLQYGLDLSTNFDSYLFQLKQRVLVNLYNSSNNKSWSIDWVIPEFSFGNLLQSEIGYTSISAIFLLGSGLNLNFSDKVRFITSYSASLNNDFYVNSYGGKEDRYEKTINRMSLLNFSFLIKL